MASMIFGPAVGAAVAGVAAVVGAAAVPPVLGAGEAPDPHA
jgi:hypothetical protein